VFYGLEEAEAKVSVGKRSIYAARAIARGEVFTEENLRIIRPGYGLHPRYFRGLLGKPASRAIALGAVPMPGVATATESFAALAAGARILKLFPAASYGAGHLKALGAVLPPDAVLLPVGGVGPAQMAEWWAAGARGFGLGSDLYRPGMIAAEVGQRAAAAVAAMRALR
jgi:hypothetical protein